MRRFLQILGIILAVLAVAIAGLVGWVAFEVNSGAAASDLTNITIPAGDQTLYAYLAQPEGEGTFPAVLMVHEWWGLRPDMLEKADRLAEQGYVVLAVDAYRNFATDAFPAALYQAINYPQANIDADMRAFYDYLVTLPNVDVNRIGVMGFCFGGRQSVQFAAQNPGAVQAVLTYYGGSQIRDVEGLRPLTANNPSVLAIFGAEDDSIPVEDRDAFTSALATLGVPYESEVYAGVGHAFVKDLDAPGASSEAWVRGVDFLGRVLVSEPTNG
ncbi:MAG: dienelactone hydrolase family protein [Phototrophicaceae bacterium]|jgi:carboxymethylenebutenolidase